MWKVVACLIVSSVVVGCAVPDAGSDGGAVTLVLPPGDPEEGRRTFQSMGCTLCHTATGEEHLPTPSSLDAGPELGLPQAERSMGEVLSAILDSTHRELMSEGDQPSEMVDYCETLTIRQLVDLGAYLRYVGE